MMLGINNVKHMHYVVHVYPWESMLLKNVLKWVIGFIDVLFCIGGR